MNIASIVLFIFTNAILAYDSADYPYWVDYDDGYCNDDYYACEGDFCMEKTDYFDIEKEAPIPNTNLTQLLDSHRHFRVLRVSALKECTPSLGLKVFIKYNQYLLCSETKCLYRTLPTVQKHAKT